MSDQFPIFAKFCGKNSTGQLLLTPDIGEGAVITPAGLLALIDQFEKNGRQPLTKEQARHILDEFA